MIDRRTMLAGGLAIGTAGSALGRTPFDAKARSIDSLPLPPSFNGALAYGRVGRVSHLRCVGMADIEAARPVTASTRFRWGSASKWLTTVAVLRLVEQQRLSLEAPITTYLPEFRRDTGERVSLRHLLSNTSGIPDLLSRQVAREPELRTSRASAVAIVARFGGGDLAFAPGAGWDYAALNWVIVAAIVERVTGKPLPDVVADLVLRPLDMSGAGFVQEGQPALPDLAAAYDAMQPPTRKMSAVPPFLGASGTVAGTVRDAVRAGHGIFHGSCLGAASLRELTTVRWPAQDYALGGRVHDIDGGRWAWETGKVGGYRAHIAHRLDRSETVVVFNTGDLDQSMIGEWVETIVRA